MPIPINTPYVGLQTASIQTVLALLAGSGITLTPNLAAQTLRIDAGAFSGQPLTEVNDTNVTLALGGTPATALLQAVSITAGWAGLLSVARGGNGAGAPFTLNTTGTVNNLNFGNASLIVGGNGSLTTLTGLQAGQDGQQVTIVSAAPGQIDLVNRSGSSSAANQLQNFATSGAMSITAGIGAARYVYSVAAGNLWVMADHFQGAMITPAYAGGNYTGNGSLVWTVDAGDVTSTGYALVGRILTYEFILDTTSISGTGNALQIAIPFTIARFVRNTYIYSDNGAQAVISIVQANAGGSILTLFKIDGSNWSASANNTLVHGQIVCEVT